MSVSKGQSTSTNQQIIEGHASSTQRMIGHLAAASMLDDQAFASLLHNSFTVAKSMTGEMSGSDIKSTGAEIKTHVPKTTVKYLYITDVNNVPLYNAVYIIAQTMMLDHTNPACLYGGFFTIYNMMDRTLLSDSTFGTDLEEHGLRLVSINIGSVEELCAHILISDPIIAEILGKLFGYNFEETTPIHEEFTLMGTDWHPILEVTTLNYDMSYTVAMIGINLTLMFKLLSSVNHKAWGDKRWTSFTNTAGVRPTAVLNSLRDLLPNEHVSPAIYQAFSSKFSIRKMMFRSIINISHKAGTWGAICKSILVLTKTTEMSHIGLISEHILKKTPFILAHPLLASEYRNLCEAFNGLIKKKIPASFYPYLKIMESGPHIDRLNRNNFPKLTYVACKIGATTSPTLQRYYGTTMFGSIELGSKLDEVAELAHRVLTAAEDGDQRASEMAGRASISVAGTRRVADSLSRAHDPVEDGPLVGQVTPPNTH